MLTALTARVEAAEGKVESLMTWKSTCEATTQDLQSTVERLEASTRAQLQEVLTSAKEASSQLTAQAVEQAAQAAQAQSAVVEESVASLAAGLERERKERAAGVLAAAREAQDTLGQV
jgi:alpha-L-fucosidase